MSYVQLAKTAAAREKAPPRRPATGRLVDHVSRVPGVPAIRLTVRETSDVEADMAFLRRLRLVLEEHVGGNLVVVTIRTLDGRKGRAEWRAMCEPTLRRRLAQLLRERAEALGLPGGRSAVPAPSAASPDLQVAAPWPGPSASGRRSAIG